VKRGLLVPAFYVLVAGSLALWALAYQYKTPYAVDVGGVDDNAYVSGFHDKEHNERLTYRWSGSQSAVRFPGIGNEPVVVSITTLGYRPGGDPPQIEVGVRGERFAVQTRPEGHTDQFVLNKGPLGEGDVTVVISSSTFSPSNDPRRLGVIVDSVSVAPAAYGLRPFIYPAFVTLAELLLGLAVCYACLLVTTRRIDIALVLTLALSATYACLIVVARRELALHAEQLPSLAAWSLLLALSGRMVMDALRVVGSARGEFAAAAGSAAFVAAFFLRFAGATYPQFLSSDLLLHVHNVQHILGGQWLFTEPLPDGTPVPYPNALYVLLAPVAALMGGSDESIGLLLKWSISVFDSATCLGLAWAGSRLWYGRTGGVAGLAYAFMPAPLVLLSAGNYSNIFGQAALNLTLLGGMVFVDGHVRPPPAGSLRSPLPVVLLFVGFVLTVLGHYGMMLGTLGIMGLFGVWAIVQTVRRAPAVEALVLVAAWGAALLSGFAVYYWHFADEISRQWSRVFERLGGGRSAAGAESGGRASGLLEFLGRRVVWVGPVATIAAVFGSFALRGLPRASGALLMSWLATALVFALLDQALGDTVRWYYLAAAPIALLAGRFLALLVGRPRAPGLLATLSLVLLLWQTLSFWVGDLIFVRYH
jgi:hypothetical protein